MNQPVPPNETAIASQQATGEVAPPVVLGQPALRQPADTVYEATRLEKLVGQCIETGAMPTEQHLHEVLDVLTRFQARNEQLRREGLLVHPQSSNTLETHDKHFGLTSSPAVRQTTDSTVVAAGIPTDQLASTIFEESQDAMLVLKANRCLTSNRVAWEMLNCTEQELDESDFFKLLKRKFSIQNEDWFQTIQQQLLDQGEVLCELRRESDEGTVWIEMRLKAFDIADPAQLLVVGHDISRQRQFQSELARSHDFLHHTINSVQEPLCVKSADMKYVLANQAFCELLGVPFEDIQGRTDADFFGAYAECSRLADLKTLESGESSASTEQLQKRDGSNITLSTFRSRFHDPLTGDAYVVASSRNVTSELKSERRQRLLASVFENAHESVAVLHVNGNIYEANPEFLGTIGHLAESIADASLEPFVDWGGASFSEIISLVQAGTPWFGHVKLLRKADEPVSCWLSLSPSRNLQEQVTNLIAMFSDITQIESTRNELRRQALHDNLTRLPNRRYFRQQITELINSDPERRSRFGVSFLDLDDFKLVNDTLGHDAGDRLLVDVSLRIKQRLGDDCFLARFGGDEFAVLIPEQNGSRSRAEEYSNWIVEALCLPFQLGEDEVKVGVSVGTTIYPDDATDVESLMRQADVAMYKAKDEGKNSVRLFTREMVEVIEHRQKMLAELRQAIDEDQLRVVYQPKFHLGTQKVIGCEALVRWRKPDGTQVSPVEFIPLAEESGLINPLGDLVFLEVCKQAARWHKAGLLRGPIAVNLSPRQLKEPNVFEGFASVLRQHNVLPEWIELEVTENSVMYDLDRAVALLNQIRDYGIGIAIDDFGTGYSSLAYIKDFPISTLKLDNAFVKGLPGDRNSVAIAKTVMSLAHGLDMEVVAEGVETEEQLEFLRSIGCDMVQGYLVSKPLEREQYETWIAQADARGI